MTGSPLTQSPPREALLSMAPDHQRRLVQVALRAAKPPLAAGPIPRLTLPQVLLLAGLAQRPAWEGLHALLGAAGRPWGGRRWRGVLRRLKRAGLATAQGESLRLTDAGQAVVGTHAFFLRLLWLKRVLRS